MYEFEGQFSSNKLVPQILDKSISEALKVILDGLQTTPKHLDISHICKDYDLVSSSLSKSDYLNNSMLRLSKLIKSNKDTIRALFADKEKIRLVEIGNGSSLKTRSIVEILWNDNPHFEFIPISNSKSDLEHSLIEIWQQFPSLNIFPLAGDYLDILADLTTDSTSKLLLINDLFIHESGNVNQVAIKLLSNFLNSGDILQLDFELKNDPRTLLRNISDDILKNNFIRTLNEMFLGDFDESAFIYYPHYNPQTGELQTCLISTKKQEVYLAIIDETINFKAWESIYIQSIHRYDLEEIENIALCAGFIPRITLHNHNQQTCYSFWQKV